MAQTYGKGLGISQSYTGNKKKKEEKKEVKSNYTPDTGKYFGLSQKSTDRKTGSGRTVSKTYNHMDMVNPSVSASQKRTQQKKEQQKFEYQSNLNRSNTLFYDEIEDKNLKTDVSLNRSKGSLNYTKKQAEKERDKNNSSFADWRDKADKVTYKNDQERLNAIKEGRKYNTLRYDDYGLSEEKLQEFDAMFGNESTRQLAKEGAALYRSRKQTQRKVQKKEDEYRNAQLKSNQNIAFNYEKAASGVQKQIDDIRSGKKKVDNANWEIQKLNNKRADYEAKAREYKQYADYDENVASMVNEMVNDKDAAKYIQRGKLDDNFIGKPNWDMGGLYPGSHMFDEEDSVKLAMMQASDKESATYQYIRGKYGDEKAQKFAEMIYEQGGLGNRYADYLGKQLDNPVYNTVQAFNAGAQNSVFGLRDAVGRVVNDEVHSEGLMNKIYQQNVESGRLNKVFGDVVYNIGNMMPAIAVSVATGGVASPAAAGVISAGVTGISSFGNTYQQARRQGFDSESATLYAAVNGASEAALQYALNGIGAMAGGGVTKALSSAAESAIERLCTKSVGRTILKTVIGQCINSLGEFEEEYLQEILDPVFRNWTLGEANGFEPFSEEALYAGFLGALSAGFMNSVEVAGNVYRYNKNGVPFVTSGEDMVSSGLDAPPTTEYNKMANEVDKENRDENGKIHLSKIEAGVFAQHQIDTESMLSEIEEAVDKENNSINWNGLSDRARALLVDPRNARYFARKYGLPIKADMAPQEIANTIKRVMLDNDLANGYIPIEMDNDIDEDVKNSLTTLQNRSNLGIYVSDNLDGDDAVTIGNKIILSREAANSDVGVIKTLVHELTHSTELSQHYNKLRDAVLKILVKNKKDIDKEIDDKIDLYKANGRLLTREGALAEVVADYCGNTLFSDLNSLVEVLADNRSVGQKILQWFQNRFKESEPYSLEHKLLGQAINNFKRAFKEIDNNSTYDRLVRQDMISRPYTPDNVPSEAPDFTKLGPKVDELRKQYDDAYKEYYDFFIEHEDEITDAGNINLDTNPEYNREIVEEFKSLADKVRYLKDKLDKAIDQNNKRAVESEPEEFSDEALESFAAAQKKADEELERQIREQEPEPEWAEGIDWDKYSEEEAKRISDFYDNIEELSGNLTVNEDTEERQKLLDKAIEQIRAKRKKRGQATIIKPRQKTLNEAFSEKTKENGKLSNLTPEEFKKKVNELFHLFRSPSGKTYEELSDHNAVFKLKANPKKLSDLIDHPDLKEVLDEIGGFEDFWDMPIRINPNIKSPGYLYNGEIVLRRSVPNGNENSQEYLTDGLEIKQTILHEMQHAIDQRMGLTDDSGTNTQHGYDWLIGEAYNAFYKEWGLKDIAKKKNPKIALYNLFVAARKFAQNLGYESVNEAAYDFYRSKEGEQLAFLTGDRINYDEKRRGEILPELRPQLSDKTNKDLQNRAKNTLKLMGFNNNEIPLIHAFIREGDFFNYDEALQSKVVNKGNYTEVIRPKRGQASISLSKDAQDKIEEIKKRRGWTAKFIGNDLLIQDALIEMGKYTPEELREYKKKNYQRLPFNTKNGWKKLGYSVNDDIESEVFPRPIDISPGLASKIEEAVDAELEIRKLKGQKAYLEKRLNNIYDKKENVGSTVKEITKVTLGIKDQISKIEERIFDLASAYSTTKKIKGDKGDVTISVDTLGLSERHARDYFSELLSYKLNAEGNKQRPRLYAELLVPDENGELSFKKAGLYASNQVVWTGQKKGATQKTYDKFQDTKSTRASERQMWNDILDDENVTTPLLVTSKPTQRTTTKDTAPKANAAQTEQKIVKGKKGISNPEKAIAFTGHRNMPYDDVAKRSQLRKIIENRIKSGHDTFISGMAMGMDLIAAEEVLALKAEHPEIKLIAAVPFNGQTAKWSKEWVDRYNKVLNAADEIHIINDSYDNNAYQSRNEWMVDNSDSIVAYYDGNNNGTGNTVKYAMSKDKMVSNIFGPSPKRGQASVKSKFVNRTFDKTAPNARDLVHLKKESGATKPEDIRRSLNNLKEKAAIQLVDSLASFEGIDYQISKQLDEEISRLQQRILGIKKGLVYSEDSKAEVKKIKKQIDSVRKKQRKMKYVYYAANNTRNASSAADFTIGLDTSGQGTYQADFSGHKIQRVDMDGNPMFDKNGQPLYCSNLHDIWAPVFEKAETDPDYYGDFLYYLRLLDHLDRAKIGKPTLPSEKLGIDWEYYKKTGIKKRTELIPMTKEEVNKLSKELLDKHPEFEDLAMQVWQYNRNNLTYLYQSQSISENLYKKLLDQHKHYIPATRDLDIKYGDTAYDTKAIKDAKGALNLPFIPTDQAMADQTRQFYLAARRNQLMNAVADAYEANKDILGNFVMGMESEVGEDQKLITDHELTAQELEDAFNPELDDKTNTTNNIIFYRNGVKTQMTVSDGIYKGYTSLWGGMSDFERVVGAPTRAMGTFFRNFVTNYNPVFIATNFLKDFGDAIFYSQDTTKFLKNFGKAWKQIVTNGDVWQLYKATGGFNSSFFEVGQGVNQKRNLFQRAFLDKIEKYNLFVEQAPRLAEFMTSLEIAGVLDNSGHLKSSGTDVLNVNESGFVSPGRTLDIETLRKAMYDANDITVNFGRGGILTKKINRSLVPFLNASVQGFDKVTRQFNQRGGKAWARLALKASILGVMPAVLNSLMYKDDDEWKHMTNWNKDNNYMFKLGNGKWIAIPRGRFMSFFAGLGNRAVQALNGDKVDWQSLGEIVETNIAPASVFDNNILAPIIRAVNNKNWYGKSIDSYEDLKKPAVERYDETTSEICKAIGKFLNISPKRVQDLFESYTGFIADVVVPATNLKSDTPVVDAFTQKFVKDSVYSNDYSSLFREYKDTIQEAVNYEGESEVPSVLSFKLRYMNNQSKEIAKLYDAISELEGSNASVEDKKDGTKALRVRINLAYQSSVNNAELLEKTIAKYYKVDPKASIKVQQRQAWSAYAKAMNELFGATEGLKAAGLSDEAMQKLIKNGVDLNDYFKYYSATHSGDKYFSTDNEGNTQTYSYAEKKQKLLNLKLDDKSLKKIYKNEFESKNTEADKSIDYAVKHGVSAKDFIKTSVAFNEIGKSDSADENISKTLQKKEWLLKNIKSTKSLETLYAMNFETDNTDEKNTIAHAKAHGVSVEAIIKREIQKAGEEGDKSGETTSNLYYDNGEIVEETSDKYISGSKLVKAVHNMLNSGFTDKEIEYFYQKEYGSDDSFVWALQAGMDAKTYLKYREDTAMITADKDENGKSINGTKKQKMFDAINAMPISKQEKLLLFMRNYKLSSAQYREVYNYIDSLNLTKEEKLSLAQGLGFDVQDGKIYMRKAS